MKQSLKFLLLAAVIGVPSSVISGSPAVSTTGTGSTASAPPVLAVSATMAAPSAVVPAAVPAKPASKPSAKAGKAAKTAAVPATEVLVQAVAIEGTVNVKPSDIAAKLRTRIGVQPTPDTLREDVKAIWDMASFDDVSVDATEVTGGLKITFLVKERPTIREVRFVNAKEFSD